MWKSSCRGLGNILYFTQLVKQLRLKVMLYIYSWVSWQCICTVFQTRRPSFYKVIFLVFLCFCCKTRYVKTSTTHLWASLLKCGTEHVCTEDTRLLRVLITNNRTKNKRNETETEMERNGIEQKPTDVAFTHNVYFTKGVTLVKTRLSTYLL